MDVVIAVVIGILLSIGIVFVVGCDRHHHTIVEAPNVPPCLTYVVQDDLVLLHGHVDGVGLLTGPIFTEDVEGCFTREDRPGVGTWTYTLESVETGEFALCEVVVDGETDYPPEGHKVRLCHNWRTIEVDEHAVDAHLAHGDYLGECEEE